MNQKKCVFCDFKDEVFVLHEDDLCMAILSKNPINKYHVLIFPKKHYEEFTKLPDNLAAHIFLVAQKLSKAVKKSCKPDAITYTFDDDLSDTGYNLVRHYKFHIIPRYKKDMPLIDWSPMRTDERDEARARYAKDVRKNLK